ncbi:MAG: hypothetical protein C4294_01935 [Nitrospiraceae bacterium]
MKEREIRLDGAVERRQVWSVRCADYIAPDDLITIRLDKNGKGYAGDGQRLVQGLNGDGTELIEIGTPGEGLLKLPKLLISP